MTLGLCYEKKGNFAGGAYHPILRRLEEFSSEPLQKALEGAREATRSRCSSSTRWCRVVAKLKERGLVSPYLRAFVVARINPLRWIQGEPPPLPEVLKTMRERLAKFNTEKVKQQDLAKMGGGAADAGIAESSRIRHEAVRERSRTAIRVPAASAAAARLARRRFLRES